MPEFDRALNALPPDQFAGAIWQRIREADSLIAIVDVPGAGPATNVSVAGEAFVAAASGKPVAILTKAGGRFSFAASAVALRRDPVG